MYNFEVCLNITERFSVQNIQKVGFSRPGWGFPQILHISFPKQTQENNCYIKDKTDLMLNFNIRNQQKMSFSIEKTQKRLKGLLRCRTNDKIREMKNNKAEEEELLFIFDSLSKRSVLIGTD